MTRTPPPGKQYCTGRRIGVLLPAVLLLLSAAGALALPEDASQQITAESNSSEVYLEQGLVVYHGTATKPARITQGSMQISGLEIRIENNADGSLAKITTTGSPARFQQQPSADKSVIHASGQTLTFDHNTQLLVAETNAELLGEGYTINSNRIEYDLVKRTASATSRSPEEQAIMTLPPPAGEQQP